jgi:hypothetical protein
MVKTFLVVFRVLLVVVVVVVGWIVLPLLFMYGCNGFFVDVVVVCGSGVVIVVVRDIFFL